MPHFMVLMVKQDTPNSEGWEAHIDALIASGKFRGGSSLGNGLRLTKSGQAGAITLDGYLTFECENREDVIALLNGNPHFEAGGTVEILELVED